MQYGLQSPEWLFGHQEYNNKRVEGGGKAKGKDDDRGDDDDVSLTLSQRRRERFWGEEYVAETGVEEVEMYER